MSYDFYLEVDVGGEEPARIEYAWWNCTSNVAPMWRKAMPETDGLAGLHGMEAGEAAEVIERGMAAMEADPETYRALNPINGWGDFDSQLERLREWLFQLRAAPKAKVCISR